MNLFFYINISHRFHFPFIFLLALPAFVCFSIGQQTISSNSHLFYVCEQISAIVSTTDSKLMLPKRVCLKFKFIGGVNVDFFNFYYKMHLFCFASYKIIQTSKWLH